MIRWTFLLTALLLACEAEVQAPSPAPTPPPSLAPEPAPPPSPPPAPTPPPAPQSPPQDTRSGIFGPGGLGSDLSNLPGFIHEGDCYTPEEEEAMVARLTESERVALRRRYGCTHDADCVQLDHRCYCSVATNRGHEVELRRIMRKLRCPRRNICCAGPIGVRCKEGRCAFINACLCDPSDGS